MKPRLTIYQVLHWADAYRLRTGKWPSASSDFAVGNGGIRWNGVNTALRLGIRGLPGETWAAVNWALRHGNRRLRGRSSLFELLRRHRGTKRQ